MSHPEIRKLHFSRSRFNVVPAGRRSYKTETRKRKLIVGDKYHKGAMGMEAGKFFFAAPTRAQAKLIAWNDLKIMTKPFWKKQPYETDMIITLITDSIIMVAGMDKPERIEGNMWHGGVLDEYGNMKPDTWKEHLRLVFSDTNGWCDFIGVPEGLNHYKELFDYSITAKDPEWNGFTWKSSDILSPDEIAALKRELDPRSYRQEVEASFENITGRACYDFQRKIHVKHMELNYNLPLYLTFDFNVNPMTTSVCQVRHGNVLAKEQPLLLCVLKAINTANSNTTMQCKILKNYLEAVNWQGKLIITGDATDQRCTESNYTNWQIIRSFFPPGDRVIYKLASKDPPVIDTLNCLNAKIRNANDEIGFYINDVDCTEAIKDLEQCVTDSTGYTILEDSKNERGHNLANIRYIAYYEFPITKKQQSTAWSN